jgi:predicted transposase/invertase (TIGR01784 family)
MKQTLPHPDKPPGRLNPLNDYLFVKVMGEKGDEEQLLGFLNAVLRRTGKDHLVSVDILENKTFTAEVIGDKSSILDIRAVLEDQTRVNIEVQLRNLGNMDRRSLFYWSREYTKSLEAGRDYLELPNVVAINIVNFEFFPGGDYHTSFHLREDRDRELVLTEALEIHFVDMVKFRCVREKDVRNDPLQRWLAWLDQDSPAGLVEEVVRMDRAIGKAEAVVEHISRDKEALRAYEMRQMALSDWTAGINHARREGMKEGIETGIKRGMKEGMKEGIKTGEEQKAVEIARNLKAIGIPLGQIARSTGLTEAQIRGL